MHHSHVLTRFNTIAIQARAQLAADREAVDLSRVRMYESKCILPSPYEIIVYSVLKHNIIDMIILLTLLECTQSAVS